MLVAAALLSVGCDATEPCDAGVAERVRIQTIPTTIERGASVDLSAEVLNACGSPMGSSVEWTSSDETVVSVDASGGTLTALNPGSAWIRATSVELGPELADSFQVTVTVDVAGWELFIHGDSSIVNHGGVPGNGQSAFYTVTALDGDGNPVDVPAAEVSWSASNARLDQRYLPNGTLLRADRAGPGTAEIRATWNGLAASRFIAILAAPPPGEVTVMLATTLIWQGDPNEVWLWALDAQGNEIPDSLVTLSSDEELMSFEWTSAGWHARGDAAGFTHVRASYGDMVGVAPVRIVYQPLELLVVGPDTLLTGETLRFSYQYRYGGGWFADSLVQWSVSDPSVLRVVRTLTDNGKTHLIVEPVSQGTAEVQISVTGPNGTVTAAGPVTVLDGAGTTRIIHQLDQIGWSTGIVRWLVPELGLTRDLGHFYSGDGAALRPSARADGAYAYVVTFDPTSTDLMSIRVVDSLGTVHWIDFASRDGEPALHPTEDLLAFTVTGGGYVSTNPISIAVAPFSGGTMDSLALGTSPTWSPDGHTIAFARAGAIYKISRHGGPETLVADVGGDPSNLDWSPDGARFIFSMGDGIYVMGSDGSSLERVADGAQPDWGPDSQQYVFNQNGRLATGLLGSTSVTYLPLEDGYRASFPVWFSLH